MPKVRRLLRRGAQLADVGALFQLVKAYGLDTSPKGLKTLGAAFKKMRDEADDSKLDDLRNELIDKVKERLPHFTDEQLVYLAGEMLGDD